MKKWLDEPKNLFGLLMGASVIAIVAGLYLALVLGLLPVQTGMVRVQLTSRVPASVPDLTILTRVVTALCAVLWCVAWGTFYRLCSRLHRGESAFHEQTGRELRIIGWCCARMAAAVFVRGVPVIVYTLKYLRALDVYALIEAIVLPGVFLTVALIAHILRGLLVHAMTLEEEQEGVV